MKKLGISLFLGSAFWASQSLAYDAFVVRSIDIQGLQRISEETVYNYLPFQLGDELDESQSNDIIKVLYKTGFFQDIQLSRDGDALVITLAERPVIGEITIQGNKDIKTDDILESLKEVGLAQGRTFDRSLMERMTNELERVYFSHGKYGVKINLTTESQPRQRVKVRIDIDEGEVARIRDINIIGNELFSDDTLLSEFTLSKKNWSSWITKSNQYARQRLESDLETVRSFYLDRGYLSFDILSTQVAMTPDKKGIYITVNISEGEHFTVGDIRVLGQTIIPSDEVEKLIKAKKGQSFSRKVIGDSITAIVERLGEEGYAFPEVDPQPIVDEDNHTVSFDFTISPGERYYVNQIHFSGNHQTQESAIRKEMVQLEGAVLSTIKVDESKERLDRTGFFQDVTVNTRPVGHDKVDLDWEVEEASSGHISGGVGFSSAEGLLFNASVSNRNFMGSGRSVDLEFNRSSSYTTYSMGYNNPYYTLDGISRGFNFYYSETDFSETTDISEYVTDAYGFGVNYGIPLTQHARASAGIGLRNTEIKAGNLLPSQIDHFLRENGNNALEYDISLGWTYSTLNRYIFPTAGVRQRLSGAVTMPGSELQYYKFSYSGQAYKRLSNLMVLHSNSNAGFGAGYGSTSRLPFYQHFFAGGTRSIRGYEESSLGPKDSLGNPFGGNLMFSTSAQLSFTRLWGEENWKSVRPSLFVDAGQAWTIGTRIKDAAGAVISERNPAGVRLSTGVAVTWVSPMGPLEFSLARPLNEKSGDQHRTFGFSVGTLF